MFCEMCEFNNCSRKSYPCNCCKLIINEGDTDERNNIKTFRHVMQMPIVWT